MDVDHPESSEQTSNIHMSRSPLKMGDIIIYTLQ